MNTSSDASHPMPPSENLEPVNGVEERGGFVMQAGLLWVALIVVLAGVIAVLVIAGSQFFAQAKAGVSLQQCANLGTVCDTDHPSRWQTGNLGQSNSEYFERDVVPYRAILNGLTPGESYSLSIGWDTSKNGRQAMDYLATYNRTVTAADPCAGLTCGAGIDTLGIPLDPALSAQGVTQLGSQVFTVVGARFHTVGEEFANTGNFCSAAQCVVGSNPSPYAPLGDFTGDRKNRITISFEASSETVVMAWGAHIAARNDWGAEFSAATIPGSPYHMRIEGFTCTDSSNCSAGQMERSINSSGVALSSEIKIVKQVDIGDQSAPEGFEFTAGPAPLTDFVLNDLAPIQADSPIWTDSRLFDDIRNEGIYTVTESALTGWELDSIMCNVVAPNGGSQVTSDDGVTIDLRKGELVTCTFFNQLASETPPTTTTTTTTPTTTTTQAPPVITQPGTPDTTVTMTMPTVIGEPDPEDPEVEIQIQAETTEGTVILPASGAVIGVADVVLALIFLTLGFGAVMLVRTRNQNNSDVGHPDIGSGQ